MMRYAASVVPVYPRPSSSTWESATHLHLTRHVCLRKGAAQERHIPLKKSCCTP